MEPRFRAVFPLPQSTPINANKPGITRLCPEKVGKRWAVVRALFSNRSKGGGLDAGSNAAQILVASHCVLAGEKLSEKGQRRTKKARHRGITKYSTDCFCKLNLGERQAFTGPPLIIGVSGDRPPRCKNDGPPTVCRFPDLKPELRAGVHPLLSEALHRGPRYTAIYAQQPGDALFGLKADAARQGLSRRAQKEVRVTP